MTSLLIGCLVFLPHLLASNCFPFEDWSCLLQTHVQSTSAGEKLPRFNVRQASEFQICANDEYEPSALESEWVKHYKNWTGADHCNHMSLELRQAWVDGARATQIQHEPPNLPSHIFSKICRAGQYPSFIEPLAGILRDPRFDCDPQVSVFSKDWLAFPTTQATGKKIFFDAGGSHFSEALDFFIKAFKAGGTVFDKIFVWEARPQGTESYWAGVDPETRSFWEPRVSFYDGVPVSAEEGSANNPVNRMYSECAPDDYCVFKLDIDTPSVELPLIQQLLGNPQETREKVDELFFEHHVQGVMQRYWGSLVQGTFADSYDLFGMLRRLGVKAHSWV